MSPKAFNHFGRKMLGLGAVALSLTVAACGSSSTASTSTPATAAPAACTVSTSDLSLGAGGTATAPKAASLTTKTLNIDGSSALQPLFKEAAASFDTANGTTTTVNGAGSGAGLTGAANGSLDIGMSDIFQSEKTGISGLTDHQVAVVIFSLVVSPDLNGKITNLTQQQVKDIFAGNITNWSKINPAVSEPITTVVRTAGSGTRATFARYVIGDPKTTTDFTPTSLTANKTGDLITAVSSNQGAIGYASTSFVSTTGGSSLGVLCIDGAKPTTTDISSGKYSFWNIEHAYTKGAPAAGSPAEAFLAFVSSSDFQSQDLAKNNFLQISAVPANVLSTHQVP